MTNTSRQFGAARAISNSSIALCTNRTASVSARKFGTLDTIAEEHLTQTYDVYAVAVCSINVDQ